MSIRRFTAAAIIAASSIAASTTTAQPLTDSFTYQGQLVDSGVPANGSYFMQFLIYDSQVGGALVQGGNEFLFDVQVTDGLFTAVVDFGSSGTLFATDQTLWIEVRVGTPDTGGVIPLSPRQQLVPTPVSNYAVKSGSSLQDAYENGNTIFRGVGDPAIDLRSSGSSTARLNLGSDLGGEPQGQLYIYGPDGNDMFRVERDNNPGGGAFVSVARNDAGSSGMIIDGNVGGIESTQVSILGPSNSIVLSTASTGDASVRVPVDAINSTEILNEVGASESSGGSVFLNPSGSRTVIASTSINCPTSGFVMVLSSSELTMGHLEGLADTVTLGVSASSNSWPISGNLQTRIPEDLPTDVYQYTVSTHGLFPVDSGAHTFYLLGRNLEGLNDNLVNDTQLTAVFIPTNYGTITANDTTNSKTKNTTINHHDQDAILADLARQQQELNAMRAQVESIMLELSNNNQPSD